MVDIVRQPENKPAPPAAYDPYARMRDLMRSFWSWDPMTQMTTPEWGSFVPQVDIKENPEGYLLKADLPGMSDKDVDLAVSGSRMTLKGTRQSEKKHDTETFHAIERNYGSFTRTFTFPDTADMDKIHAELKDGVLTVMVPRKAGMTPKKITVKK